MDDQSEVLGSVGPPPWADGTVETGAETAPPPEGAALGTPGEAAGVAPGAGGAAGTAAGAPVGPACSPCPTIEEIAAATRDAVSQALAGLNLTAEAARTGGDIEQIGAMIARLPNQIRGGLDSSFSVLLERIEDAKGLVAFNRQRRLFLDLLALYDMMRDLERSVESDPRQSGNFLTLRDQLVQTLAMNGVARILTLAGTPFNPQHHRAVKVVPATDACGDGCIDSIVRDGFSFGTFVLRPAEVAVGRTMSAPNNAGGGNG